MSDLDDLKQRVADLEARVAELEHDPREELMSQMGQLRELRRQADAEPPEAA